MKSLKPSLLAALFLSATALAPAKAESLTIYTYGSFNSDWGPGPAIKKGFEEQCGCTIEFVSPGDATETFNRLRLEGKSSKADVLVGLDSNLVAEAEKSGLFQPHGAKTEGLSLPVDWDSSTFLPFDWGYFAFVYDSEKVKQPPASFKELLDAPEDLKILIQDPRSSTPGLGLMLWVKQVYGDKAQEAWAKLAPRIVTVTKGWSEAYGMFLEGQADMVLSYTTSPAYHIAAEKKTNFKAASFKEGHYMQLELAAITKSSDQKELATQFLNYLTGPEGQKVIPTTNWMYPVRIAKEGLPEAFKDLVQPEKSMLLEPAKVTATRKQALDEWLAALSK